MIASYSSIDDIASINYPDVISIKDEVLQKTIAYFDILLPLITKNVTADYNIFSNYLTNQKYYYYENMTYNSSFPLYGSLGSSNAPLPTN